MYIDSKVRIDRFVLKDEAQFIWEWTNTILFSVQALAATLANKLRAKRTVVIEILL